MPKRILIVGAGVAGPALALALQRSGAGVTVVERAPALRTGGQAVDFRGPVHRAVLERLGLWDAIHAERTRPSELVLLHPDGSVAATLPAVMMAGDVEILRGDLGRILYERTRDATTYRFGDHPIALCDRGDAVDVRFASGAEETYDYVVGADGLHSSVRTLSSGDDPGSSSKEAARVLRHHGFRIATFATENLVGDLGASMVYSVPGRALCLSAHRHDAGRALLVYAGAPFGPERRDLEAQRRDLHATFAGVGWEAPRVLDSLDRASDLYVDAIATVRVPRYHRGRIVLLGDAAWGGTLGGQGTSLAVVGAWVLAGELARSSSPDVAFKRFEATMRPYATRCQAGAARAGGFFAPSTLTGVRLRNAAYAALTSRWLAGFFEWLVKDAASDLALPDYAG